MPSILGIVASLLSAICMHLLDSGEFNEFGTAVFQVGTFAMFPLWQYLIGLNLDYHSKSFYSKKIAETANKQE